MGYTIGIALALCVYVFGRVAGFDRDRAYYATMLIVVAHYYVLFAVMGGSTRALIVESLVMGAFIVAAVVGFKTNLWLIVAGLAAHGVFDLFHGHFVMNPGVPDYWPAFCMAFDVGAAGFLAYLSLNSPPQPAKGPLL